VSDDRGKGEGTTVNFRTSAYDRAIQDIRRCEADGGEMLCFMKMNDSLCLTSVHSHEGLTDTILKCRMALSRLEEKELGGNIKPELDKLLSGVAKKPRSGVRRALDTTFSMVFISFIPCLLSSIFVVALLTLSNMLIFR
jgi:hypothetical protein